MQTLKHDLGLGWLGHHLDALPAWGRWALVILLFGVSFAVGAIWAGEAADMVVTAWPGVACAFAGGIAYVLARRR